jgi:hypothetical protein
MSPDAPSNETRGFNVAVGYYTKRPLLTPSEILQSAELLREYFNKQGYEFYRGFLDGATYMAHERAGMTWNDDSDAERADAMSEQDAAMYDSWR